MLVAQLASQLGMPSTLWDTCNWDRRAIKSNLTHQVGDAPQFSCVPSHHAALAEGVVAMRRRFRRKFVPWSAPRDAGRLDAQPSCIDLLPPARRPWTSISGAQAVEVPNIAAK